MLNKKLSCMHNGQKGGRPKQDSEIYMELPEVKLVILTPEQYISLIQKYGYSLLERALLILDSWLGTGGKKYAGKNNYAHFRADGWLINEAMRAMK